MHEMQRRALLERRGLGALAFTVGGRRGAAHAARGARPGRAVADLDRRAGRDPAMRSARHSFPARAQAGISHFIDQQLSVPAEEALLEARILNVRPPYANFYRAALGAVDSASQALNGGRSFAQLSEPEQREFVDSMRQNKIEGWQGPAGVVRLFAAAQRRRRCRLRHHGRLRGLGIPYMAAYRADEEVVTWRTKK